MTPTVTGNYDIINTATRGISDPYIYVYTGSFNPNSLYTNYLTEDDDSGVGLLFRISNLLLTAGTTYILVPTVFSPGQLGSFDFKVSGAGSVSAVVAGGDGGTEPSGPVATDIVNPATQYLSSDLGTTVNPVFAGGTLTIDADATYTQNFTAGAAAIDTAGKTATLSGVISNVDVGAPGSLVVSNSSSGGSLTLSGANTYTGTTSIQSGATLNLTGSLASSAVTVVSGATLNNTNGGLAATATLTNAGTVSLGANDTIASLVNSGTINGSATLTAATYALNNGSVINANLGTGAVVTNGAAALNGTSGASTVNVQTGTLALGSANRLSSSAAVDVSSGAALQFGGNETISALNGSGSVAIGAYAFTLSSGNFGGIVSGSGVLAKTGVGTLTLTGANTYTGATQIQSGTVDLQGSLASSAVTVSSGATLTNANGGLAETAVLANAGTVTLSANDTVASLINSGTLNGSGKLTAATYTLNTDSVINANLGAGVLAVNGFSTLNGSADAATVTINSGGLLLVTAAGLSSDAAVTNSGVLSSELDDTVASLVNNGLLYGPGKLTAATYTLNHGSLIRGDLGAGVLTVNGTASLEKSADAATVVVNQDALFLVTNAGLSADAAVTNAGTIELSIDDTVSSLINSGTINGPGKFTAETYALNNGSVINANLGSGVLTSNGNVALNGYANTATIAVDSGVLTLGSANRLLVSSAVTIADGGKLQLGGNETIRSLNGAGAVDLGASGLGVSSGTYAGVIAGSGGLSKNDSGVLTLTGVNTYTGLTQVRGGTLALDGSIASENVVVNAGSTLNVAHSGLASSALLANAGTVALGANETVAALVNSGTVNGPGTLSAEVYDLHDGSIINGNLGRGTLVSNGAVRLNGTSEAETVKVETGALTLGSGDRLSDEAWVDVRENARLVLSNGNDTIRLLSGGGDIDLLNSSVLTVREGFFSGAASSSGALLKDSNPLLTLAGNNTYEAGTIVRSGQIYLTESGRLNSDVHVEGSGAITVDGVVNGELLVEHGGVLRGRGYIASNVTNHGLVAPGNSPGVLTVGGNYTHTGVLSIEIDGRAGAGVNPGGHDQLKVGGKVTLVDGSTLQLTRSAGIVFEPAMGERFLVIDSAGGISGEFSQLDRSAFTTKLLFDYGTGYVYGTGVSSDAPAVKMGGTTPNAKALATLSTENAITNDTNNQEAFIDSRTAAGALFISMLQTPASSQALDRLSPAVYTGFSEYALRVTRNYSRDLERVPALVYADGWQVSAGYTNYRHDIRNNSVETDANLRSYGVSAGVARNVGSRVVLGGYYSQDRGSVRGHTASFDSKGHAVGLYANLLRKPEGRLSADAGVSFGSFEFEGQRTSMNSLVLGKTEANSVDGWIGAEYLLLSHGRFSLSALADLAYTSAKIDGFTELGGNDALRISQMREKLALGEFGVKGSLALFDGMTLSLRVSQSHNFEQPERHLDAGYASGGNTVRLAAPGIEKNQTEVGVSLRYALADRMAAGAYYEKNLSDKTGASTQYGMRVSIRF